MKQFKKRIIHALLFFYLFSSYLGASHIHHDQHLSHDDCKVCIVVKNLHSGDMPLPVVLPGIEKYRYQEILNHHSLHASQPHIGFDAHAPPLCS